MRCRLDLYLTEGLSYNGRSGGLDEVARGLKAHDDVVSFVGTRGDVVHIKIGKAREL